ncbi:MAG: alpha/beta hydrolase, partial [Gammaproteobacteria bacterium]|nr:alpha/beta hydrolase [Gammaproteobacteria bacterium]
YLAHHTIENLGRVVMLAPPNHGSEVVDALRSVPGFRLMNGPAGMQLGTEPDSVPSTLGPADFELGVIAGTSTMNLLLSLLLPDPNDGKVSVASARLEGMKDFVTVSRTHTFIMNAPEVIAMTRQFLASGQFASPASDIRPQ